MSYGGPKICQSDRAALIKALKLKYADQKGGFTALFVTSRKALSAQTVKLFTDAELQIKSYRLLNGQLNLDGAPLSVWQIDSLPRAFSGTATSALPTFDCIVLDEICQTIGHSFTPPSNSATSATSWEREGKALKGMSMLRALVQRCRHLLVCDQDLNAAIVKAFVETARAGRRYRVYNNLYSPWSDPHTRASNQPLQLRVVQGPLARETVVRKVLETVKAENQKRLEFGDESHLWSGTHVVFHSLLECEAVMDLIARELKLSEEDQAKYLGAYNSNTPEHIKIADLSDAKKAWSKKVVIGTTSSVSVGTMACCAACVSCAGLACLFT